MQTIATTFWHQRRQLYTGQAGRAGQSGKKQVTRRLGVVGWPGEQPTPALARGESSSSNTISSRQRKRL